MQHFHTVLQNDHAGAVLGALIGVGITVALVAWLASVGIPIAGMEEMAGQFYMQDRMYPAFSVGALVTAPVVLLIGTQIAGALASLRIHRLRPVEAMRAE